MTEEVQAKVLRRIATEIDRIDYFTVKYDPSWCFMAWNRLETALIGGEFDYGSNPCSAMAGYTWHNLPCKDKYQSAAREEVTGALSLLDREVKKTLNPNQTECQAV